MSDREDKIRRVVAELDVHLAEIEASVAVLKALLADGEVPGRKTPVPAGTVLDVWPGRAGRGVRHVPART